MTTAKLPIFAAALLYSMIASRAPLHAQPASAPISVDGDNKPWNKGVSLATREAARQIFLEGNRLLKVPLFAQAAEQYTAALEKWKHPAFYFNLAVAQLNLGQDIEARDNLEKALNHGREALGADQFEEAQKQLQELERQLGQIRIGCQTPGAEVTLDGITLFTGPGSYRGWVRAKPHEITAKKPDYLAEARRVTIMPGAFQDIDLKLITLSEAADTGRRWAVWKPWAVVIAGATVAATGGAVHVAASQNFSNYDAQFLALSCANTGGCKSAEVGPKLDSQLTTAKREQKIAIAGYIAGGSMIVTGAVLLYMNRPRLKEGAIGSSARIAIVPSISTDILGILVSVSH